MNAQLCRSLSLLFNLSFLLKLQISMNVITLHVTTTQRVSIILDLFNAPVWKDFAEMVLNVQVTFHIHCHRNSPCIHCIFYEKPINILLVKCSDNNECKLAPCHPNASCINFPGSFQCSCFVGFSGDGTFCEGKIEIHLISQYFYSLAS